MGKGSHQISRAGAANNETGDALLPSLSLTLISAIRDRTDGGSGDSKSLVIGVAGISGDGKAERSSVCRELHQPSRLGGERASQRFRRVKQDLKSW